MTFLDMYQKVKHALFNESNSTSFDLIRADIDLMQRHGKFIVRIENRLVVLRMSELEPE